MKLEPQDIKGNAAEWQAKGYHLPDFDREAVRAATKASPQWVHFGAGNIFRAFTAAVQQALLEQGAAETGIIVAEGYDYEIIDAVNRPHDDLSLLVTLKADGSIEKTVVGSVVESIKCDSEDAVAFGRLREIFTAPSLQMASFTITEKGYSVTGADGALAPAVAADIAAGPERPGSYIGKLASLLVSRYGAGALPLALVSMDNCSHNGTRLYEAVHTFAKGWADAGHVDAGFVAYVEDPARVSFPWSMIDKITPRPDEGVCRMLEADGFEDTAAVVTAKNTYVAPFVNAEEAQYLVIEDAFPNGRPALDKGGVIFTARETVDKVEKMKVCTCLNPLHTAMSIFGCLLGYEKISEEMKDEDIVALIRRVGYIEGLPVVVDPGIIDPRAFIDEVIGVRFPNPFMPDTPQRIMCDTSQKLPVRFGETIKAYLARPELAVDSLAAIPLVLAGWCRYLLGVDDAGKAMELSPDPMLEAVRPYVQGIGLGEEGPFHEALAPLLKDARIFGVDLYEAGLGEKVEDLFSRMVKGPGAVRETLHAVVVNDG